VGLDPVFGRYIILSTVTGRVSSATKKCYPHGLGALVARTGYTYSLNHITNGDFELGDLTDWEDWSYHPGTSTGSAEVTNDSKASGSYGCKLSASSSAVDDGAAKIRQEITADFDRLALKYKINDSDIGNNLVWVFIGVSDGDSIEYDVISLGDPASGDWQYFTINKPDIPGFTWSAGSYVYAYAIVHAGTGTNTIELFIDDISVATLDEGSGTEPGSPIALYGISVLDETVDNNVTYGDLDAYATMMLLGLGNFWKKATCWLPMTNSFVSRIAEHPETNSVATPIMVGDRISITESLGATPDEWEVVGVETIFDEGRMKLELGDYEKNIFTSLERKTNALNRTMT
jgi:hypothetical protein